MAHGSRICPYCGGLNGQRETICHRCQKRLPGPLGTAVLTSFREFVADGMPVTKLVFGACVLLYALGFALDGGTLQLGMVNGFHYSTLLRFGIIAPPVANEWWRLLSAVYLHLGVLHIALNMMALADFGRRVEPRFGSARFFVLYTLTGILGFVASNWWYGGASPTAGASGALFGLIGAEVGEMAGRRQMAWKKAFINYLVYAGIISFMLPVNGAAHVGGFLAGVACGFVLTIERNPRKRDGLLRGLAGLCVVASVGSVVLSARSPVWKEAKRAELRQAEEAE